MYIGLVLSFAEKEEKKNRSFKPGRPDLVFTDLETSIQADWFAVSELLLRPYILYFIIFYHLPKHREASKFCPFIRKLALHGFLI